VLLLEAGGRDDNHNIHIPLMVANVLNDTRWTWPYMTEAQTHLNGKPQAVRRRVIAARARSTAISSCTAIPRNTDAWRDEKVCGLGLLRVAPIFKRLRIFRRAIRRARAW
jgi:choline dehydrogenase-like flavoprotein